jgi:hypothetical protein
MRYSEPTPTRTIRRAMRFAVAGKTFTNGFGKQNWQLFSTDRQDCAVATRRELGYPCP